MDKHILAKKYLSGVIFKKFSRYQRAKKVFKDIGNTPWYLRVFYKTKCTSAEKIVIVLNIKEYLLEELSKKVNETNLIIEDLEKNFTIREAEYTKQYVYVMLNEYKQYLKHLLYIKNYYINRLIITERKLSERNSSQKGGFLSYYEDSDMYFFNKETYYILESINKDIKNIIKEKIN